MTPSPLPPHVSLDVVSDRLERIFPTGSPSADIAARPATAKTVFVLLYIGAIDGTERWLAPKHVYSMTDRQAALASDDARLRYGTEAMRSGFKPPEQPWYAAGTREPVRDESIRQGLMPVGAIIERQGTKVTSPIPRYALARAFAALFDPGLTGAQLADAIAKWQARAFDHGSLTRLRLVRAGASLAKHDVVVTFPNRETRKLSPGTSSVIAKALIEEFAPRFLEAPAVVWLSDSGRKVVTRDDDVARAVGLVIDPQRALPDVILVDLRADADDAPLLVFAEIVHSDGPISDRRRTELIEIASGFDPERIAFVTAFEDRSTAPARRLFHTIAFNTFVWYASEPERVVVLRDETSTGVRLHALLPSVKPSS